MINIKYLSYSLHFIWKRFYLNRRIQNKYKKIYIQLILLKLSNQQFIEMKEKNKTSTF